MHLETLKIFCDLADLQSFSRTADKNFLTQSAVSQQLAQLELAHKCKLINRKKRPIELTKAGQLLYRAAKDMTERYEDFRTSLNSLKSKAEERLNVAAIFSIGMHSLPDYLKKFMVKFPNIHLHVEYLSADRIYQLLYQGQIDIGIVAIAKKDNKLQCYDFQDEPLVLVCSPRHPLANMRQIEIQKLQFERFIGFEENVPTRAWIDNILHEHHVNCQPVMEFDNIETIKRAVEISSGVSILPEPTILNEINTGSMKAIPFANETFSRPTNIIVRKDRVLGQAGRYFIELLRKKT